MLWDRGLLFLSDELLGTVFLPADQFKVIISYDLFLFFKSILEHVKAIEANFDIVSYLHNTTEVCRLT